ncbi:MAG: hypothetical protein JWP85_2117 [Rhodoglobus sp.]|nr:hypothetical protein [Rhodoglobus sp.]
MKTHEENYLLTAVDKLSQKHLTRVMQSKTVEHRDAEGELLDTIEVACVSVIDHDPLLIQLRDAIGSSTGSKGASSDGAARIPFNPAAQALFDPIARQINAWYIVLPNAREERHIHDRLRDWFTDFENRRRAGKLHATEENDTTRMVEGWVRSIEAMFDPPNVFEVTDDEVPAPCPLCGGRYAIDERTGDRITALIIEYRNLGAETMEHATGLCRSCYTVWEGSSGLRNMRWAIENEPAVGVATIEGLTAHQITMGMAAALKERNMKSVSSLLALLGQLNPAKADELRDVVRQVLAADKAARKRAEAARRAKEAEERRRRHAEGKTGDASR